VVPLLQSAAAALAAELQEDGAASVSAPSS
jgi:hypothetical protein